MTDLKTEPGGMVPTEGDHPSVIKDTPNMERAIENAEEFVKLAGSKPPPEIVCQTPAELDAEDALDAEGRRPACPRCKARKLFMQSTSTDLCCSNCGWSSEGDHLKIAPQDVMARAIAADEPKTATEERPVFPEETRCGERRTPLVDPPTVLELSSFDAWEIRGAMIEANRLHAEAEQYESHAESVARKAVEAAGHEFGKDWRIDVDANARRVALKREAK